MVDLATDSNLNKYNRDMWGTERVGVRRTQERKKSGGQTLHKLQEVKLQSQEV